MMISYDDQDCKEKKDLSRKGKCRYGIYFTTMQYAKYSNLDLMLSSKQRQVQISYGQGTICCHSDHFVILSRTIIGELSILTRGGSCFKSFGGASRIV